MQTSIYAKFLGKSFPSDQAKLALAYAWRELGAFIVSDLLNGYYYICCENAEMQSRLLKEGSWTVAERILQLSPWKETFQPAFELLAAVAVWIQLYHLPMELWGGDILEKIASQFGNVLKVDKHTLDMSRENFTLIYKRKSLLKYFDLSPGFDSNFPVGNSHCHNEKLNIEGTSDLPCSSSLHSKTSPHLGKDGSRCWKSQHAHLPSSQSSADK